MSWALQAYHERHATLASFATEVVALDEMHLDHVKKHVPILRHCPKGDLELLPGKLVALFDVRLHHWRAIDYLEQATKNGLEQAKALLHWLKPGALVLADLGYYSFEWFDDLTEQGYRWISRVKDRTSVVVVHTSYEVGETFDRFVWLGAWNTQGKHVVRQVQFRQGGRLRHYFTNVCDPTVLPVREIARLYARRWDIELAFLTLKRDVGLHLIWSGKPVVVLAQVWACLIIAQVVQALRLEVALQADVDAFEVSLPFLLETLPLLHSHEGDPLTASVRQGRRLGIIRPSTRLSIEAPEIPSERLIPLPKDTILCRQPCSRSKRPSEKAVHSDIHVHPQRDQLVAILMRREAEMKAAAHHRTTTRPTDPSTIRPFPSPPKTREGSSPQVTRCPPPPVQPESRLPHLPWPHLAPLFAHAEKHALGRSCEQAAETL